MSSRNSRGRASDPAVTRARLIEAADRVFAERGYAAASVQEICRVAGFTRGAFYANYESKDELLLAVIEMDDEAHATDAKVDGDVSTDSYSLSIADRLSPEERRLRDLVRIEFILYAARRPELWARVLETAAKRRSLVADRVAGLGRDFGFELPFPAEDLARLLLALNTGLAMADFFVAPEDEHRQRLTDVMLALIARAAPTSPTTKGDAE